MVHICHSCVVPDLIDYQDALMWYWAGNFNIYLADWVSLHWRMLRLTGLDLIHHCCCFWFQWVVPDFNPLLRLLCCYPHFLRITMVVDFFHSWDDWLGILIILTIIPRIVVVCIFIIWVIIWIIVLYGLAMLIVWFINYFSSVSPSK